MKKALIVFGTTAALLVGVLSPTTSFAAENVTQNGIKASFINTSVSVPVGGIAYLSGSAYYVSTNGSDCASVNYFSGEVRGLKKGYATVTGYDKNGKYVAQYYINVY
ncbi:hypothetical protein ABE142_24245 [Paenibacillus alvei]|uniref:hypothetical protein n=1 Tax=Paenibacillus alvei TaxID=44250 RepID=UPI003D2CE889